MSTHDGSCGASQSKETSDIILVRKSEVPAYLRSGEFFQSLSDEDDEQISVPSNVLKMDTKIESNADLDHLLCSLRFWSCSDISEDVIIFCLAQEASHCDEVLARFSKDFPYLITLAAMLPTRDEVDRLAIAAESGILEIVQNLPENTYAREYACCVAARNGHLQVLQYLFVRVGEHDEPIMASALWAKNGAACVKYLHEQGVEWPANPLSTALRAGNKEAFHYALQHGCTWENDTPGDLNSSDQHAEMLRYAIQYGYKADEYDVAAAASCGAVRCLQVLYETHCPWDENCCISAAFGGHLNCLVYLHEHGCPWDGDTVEEAAACGSLDCVQYALEQGCDIGVDSCTEAAKHGYLHILQYLHEHGAQWSNATCAAAAGGGHLECLKYAHEHGCDWSAGTCKAAAEQGHLHCLRYAHEQGCDWSIETTAAAAKHGQLECLRYAHKHECMSAVTTCTAAAEGGSLECLIHAHEHGCPWSEVTCASAAAGGHLDCLQYAHELGCKWNTDTTYAAARFGHLACLKYAYEHGCGVDNKAYMNAKHWSHMDCVAYIKNVSEARKRK